MNKLAKKMNRRGFTLVELIVVIAILAILAGVAIPVYSNYIKEANKAADYQLLDSIKTAAAFAATEKGIKLATPTSPEITGIVVENNSVTVTTNPAVTVTMADITNYCGTNIVLKGCKTATWADGAWTLTGDAVAVTTPSSPSPTVNP